MEQREPRKSFRHYVYIAFAFIVLITCWESGRTDAAGITPAIPQESIRIRILANSDSPQDQVLKGEIREAVVASMQSWVSEPQTIQQARSLVNAHLAELDLLVGDMIRGRGYTYSHQVELGVVPFPAKMYENEQYPAGDYEALRITVGSGKGQNWWCVLFPPLCFVDTFTGSSAAGTTANGTTANGTTANGATPTPKKVIVSLSEPVQHPAAEQPAEIEVRFFLWDFFAGIASWFK